MAEEVTKIVNLRESRALSKSRQSLPALEKDPQTANVLKPLPAKKHSGNRFSSIGFVSFLVVVIIPTLVVAAYLNFYATPRYSSEFRAVVRTAEPAKVALPALIGLTGASQSNNDSQAVVQYLQSREPITELGRTVNLRAMYQNPQVDWWSRLKEGASIEDLQEHWNNMVDVFYETSTGTIVVKVSAYSPNDALNLATSSLELSEALINRMTSRVRDDTLAFATKEVDNAKEKLSNISLKLQALRNKESILDPRKTAEQDLSLESKLRVEISQLSATLTLQRSQLSENSPPVKATRGRIAALEQELKKVSGRITSNKSSDNALSAVIGDFEQLESERIFAEKAFQSALASLESARMDAGRQQIYLATIVRPTLPEDPSFPRPIYTTLLVLLGAITAWLVAMLLFNAMSGRS